MCVEDISENTVETRIVRIRMDTHIYAELVKRYGVRGISKVVNEVLRQFLEGELFREDTDRGESRSVLDELRRRARTKAQSQ